MGTQIILMDGGVIQQQGTPKEIYDRPANTFVARFIGSPPMNLIPVTIDGDRIANGDVLSLNAPELPSDAVGEAVLGVRAERIRIVDHGVPARVAIVERLGAETVVGFRLGHTEPQQLGSSVLRNLYYARIPGDVQRSAGDEVHVEFDLAGVSWFDAASGQRLSSTADR